ncbi:unnamed protein product [Arctia plantaginis]|uniref:Uncharacterized protein n=1 Tax=Arctia plantaginis TaxID=874455 RepID=A0A8S0ZV35_ARCPL|nr:unnamed protein product [Arctia plantaginis]
MFNSIIYFPRIPSRRRHRGDGEEDRLHEEYRRARKTLKLAISRAKEEKRQEMLEGLNRDPWGRPYRAVRQKLRASGPPPYGDSPAQLPARSG